MKNRSVTKTGVATALVGALVALGLIASGPAAVGATGGDEDGRSIAEQQREAHPGHGHTFRESGLCAGTWQDDVTGTCTHVDAASGLDSLLDDGAETYDLEYTAALTNGTAYCSGDSPGNRVRVLYVTTTSREDRYSSLVGTLRNKAERADYWVWKSARQTSGNRHIRYVCLSDNKTIEVVKVVLANAADDSWSNTKTYLRNAGYNNSNRKYIAFIDWAEKKADGTRSDTICGRGEIYDNDSASQSNPNNGGNMIGGVYLRAANCVNAWAKTAMHEIGHTLGAVQKSAPRHDGQNTFHPRDEYDRLAYGSNTFIASGCGDTLLDKRYDCNKNDYFHTSPASGTYLSNFWNTARNKFLVGGG